jgi:hypothetical protein
MATVRSAGHQPADLPGEPSALLYARLQRAAADYAGYLGSGPGWALIPSTEAELVVRDAALAAAATHQSGGWRRPAIASATDVVAQAMGCDGSTQRTRSGSTAASIARLTTIDS